MKIIYNKNDENLTNYVRDFLELREKAVAIRKIEEELLKSRKDSLVASKEFVEKYSKNNPKLGEFASLLDNKFSASDFLHIMEKSTTMNEKELKEYASILKRFMVGGINQNLINNQFINESLGFNKDLINKCQSFIENLDSIELNEGCNSLNSNRYLISENLHWALLKGSKLKWQNYKLNRSLVKGSEGVYLVVFKVLNKPNSDTIIYRYINYSGIFAECLLHYIVNEQMSTLVHGVRSVGSDYLFFLGKGFNLPEEFIKYINSMSHEFTIRDSKRVSKKPFSSDMYPRNIVDIYKLMIKGKLIIGDYIELSLIIRLAIEGELNELSKILSTNSGLVEDKYIKDMITSYNPSKLNLLSRCVFVVKDLEDLKEKIADQFKGVNVNEGVQKWRGFVDSLSNTVSVFDQDFRNSIKRHNEYFINTGQIHKSKVIGRNRFSYNNIHINLGNARWYSTYVNKLSKENKEYHYRNDVEKELLNTRMAISILSILEKNNKNISDKQLELEKFIFYDWEDNMINNLKKSSDFGNSEGISILINSIENCTFAVEEFKMSKRHLKGKKYRYIFINTPSDIIISIIICRVMPYILKIANTEGQDVTGLLLKIGNHLIKAFYKAEFSRYIEWEKNKVYNFETYKLNIQEESCEVEGGLGYQDFISKLPVNTLESSDILKYALDLVELVSVHTKLYSVKEFYNSESESSKRVLLHDSQAKDKLLNILSYDNNTFPMISPPNDWDVYLKEDGDFKINKYGGYIKNIENRESFIHKSYKNVGFIKLSNKSIINTINYLQKVEYIINKDVINTITDCLQDGSLESYLYLNYHPRTDQLSNLKAEKDYYKIGQILKYNSICYNNRSILTNALILKDNNEIYFPLFIDWRGRIYSKTSSFSYQGSDLSKSLFLFKKGETINQEGVNKLKLYAANCYGIKRLSNEKLLAWVDDNLNNIINIEDRFWMEGKEPLQSLAASIELRKYYESSNKEKFVTYLPIYIDATCNGIQHLASMASDVDLANYVNLCKSTDSDIPGDIYGVMADRVRLELSELIKENPDYAILEKININRNFVKRGIMTIPYGVTKRGIRDQLLAEHFLLLSEKDDKGIKLYKANDRFIDSTIKDVVKFRSSDITILAGLIHNVLFNTYPNIKNVVKYLTGMNSFLKNLGSDLAILWKTPSGLILEQKYIKFDKKNIKTNILGRPKTITLKVPLIDKLDLKKQNQGIVPNLIHSLDASNISILVNKMIEDNHYINLLTIHDCFSTNANHIEDLAYRIKLAFLVIYGNRDYLDKFHEYILEYLGNIGFNITKEKDYVITPLNNKIKIPNPPTPGDLDLKKEFMFSSYFVH